MTALTKRLFLPAGLLLLALLLFWAGLTILFPAWLAGRLLPDLAARHGLDNLRVRPVLVGPGRLQGEIFLGPEESPALHVASVAVDYSLATLLQREIDRLSFSGVEMRCRIANGRPQIEDAGLQRLLDGAADPAGNSTPTPRPVFLPRHVTIRQAALLWQTESRVIRLPFAADIDLGHLAANAPLTFRLTITPGNEEVRLAGHYDRNTNKLRLDLSTDLLHPATLAAFAPFFARFDETAALALTATADLGLRPLIVHALQGSIALHPGQGKPLTLAVNGDQAGNGLPLQIALRGGPWAATLAGPRGKIPLQAEALALRFSLPPAPTGQGTSGRRLDGELVIDGISLGLPQSGLAISQINLRFPFTWPFSGRDQEGTISAEARAGRENAVIGRFKGRVRQEERGISLSGTLDSDLLHGAMATTSLSADFSDTTPRIELAVDLPATRLRQFSPASLPPAASGAVFNGTIAGHLAGTFANRALSGSGKLTVTDGELTLPRKKIAITGIATEINFPDLPKTRSGPGQHLTFSKGSLAALHCDGGSVTFTIESPHSLLLETATLNWAGGTLSTHALRFGGGQPPAEVVLYGNRLRLATILGLAGIDNVEGDGTVNGRIPILLNNGRISFAPSFLYSSPGEGGVIRIAGGDFLTRAIPATSPQFGQLDFAQEALRHFSYNWAKLHLVSEDDILLMQLSLDGKPAKPLPFAYDQAAGGFRRLPAGTPVTGGISHPVILDANFRFPLNTFLEYDKSIQEFLRRETGQ